MRAAISEVLKKLFKGKMRYILPMAVLTLISFFMKKYLYGYGFLVLILMCIAAVIFCFYLLSFTNAHYATVIKRVLACGIAVVTVMMIIVEIPIMSASRKKEKADSDYCIVLGCAIYGTIPSRVLAARINSAYEFLTENPDAKAILSGGQGPGEDISEAQCMFNMLSNRGIAPERLIKEDKSTSTKENLKYSRELLDEIDPGVKGLTVISSETHLYRACLLARDAGFEPKPYRAVTRGPIIIAQYLREGVAVWYEWIF